MLSSLVPASSSLDGHTERSFQLARKQIFWSGFREKLMRLFKVLGVAFGMAALIHLGSAASSPSAARHSTSSGRIDGVVSLASKGEIFDPKIWWGEPWTSRKEGWNTVLLFDSLDCPDCVAQLQAMEPLSSAPPYHLDIKVVATDGKLNPDSAEVRKVTGDVPIWVTIKKDILAQHGITTLPAMIILDGEGRIQAIATKPILDKASLERFIRLYAPVVRPDPVHDISLWCHGMLANTIDPVEIFTPPQNIPSDQKENFEQQLKGELNVDYAVCEPDILHLYDGEMAKAKRLRWGLKISDIKFHKIQNILREY